MPDFQLYIFTFPVRRVICYRAVECYKMSYPSAQYWGQSWLRLFTDDQNEGIKSFLSHLADDDKLGKDVVLLQSREGLQRNLGRLDQRAKDKDRKFNKAKSGHNKCMEGYRLGAEWLEDCPVRKDLGYWPIPD